MIEVIMMITRRRQNLSIKWMGMRKRERQM